MSEALGHELAIACLGRCNGLSDSTEPLRDALPFRTLIGDPFDLNQRAIIPAVTTLTIRLRRYPAEPSFLLHWRDPAKVATAAGVYDVIPAGEFQPASVALWDRRNDFDLWRNIVREYSEELLSTPEHDGTRSKPIDYNIWPLYQELEDAQTAGALVSFVLGLGLDAAKRGQHPTWDSHSPRCSGVPPWAAPPPAHPEPPVAAATTPQTRRRPPP